MPFRLVIRFLYLSFLFMGCQPEEEPVSVFKDGVPLYGNWCGAGHSGGEPHGPATRDIVDRACQVHDQCYDQYGQGNLECDYAFIQGLEFAYTVMQQRIADFLAWPFLVKIAREDRELCVKLKNNGYKYGQKCLELARQY